MDLEARIGSDKRVSGARNLDLTRRIRSQKMHERIPDGERFGVDGLLDLVDVTAKEDLSKMFLGPLLTVGLDVAILGVECDITPTPLGLSQSVSSS